MIQQLVQALIASENEAADQVPLEALRLGNVTEQGQALDALIKRETTRGLSGAADAFVQRGRRRGRAGIHRARTSGRTRRST